ncbi:MAG TPA: hypothetical protein VGG72_35965 [Bryobacteraceae bacterium]
MRNGRNNRVTLGALYSDSIPDDKPRHEWGFQFAGASLPPTFSLVVRSSDDFSTATAGMGGKRENGTYWQVP